MTTIDTPPVVLPTDLARQLVEAEDGETLGAWTLVTRVHDSDRRWTARWNLIIQGRNGQHHSTPYEVGLTEAQDGTRPFEDDGDTVEFVPVYPTVRRVTDSVRKPVPSPHPGQDALENIESILGTYRRGNVTVDEALYLIRDRLNTDPRGTGS
ncbi:hypothetical protein [Actinomadura yumaensis]|uniref:Immunity repressor n=1 Tax=Actinomadura yumaensis TaxID=111807 RepID=A0ABW2CS72_9ACTN